MGAFRRLQPGIELIEAANGADALDALLKHSIPIFRRMPELGEEQRRALELIVDSRKVAVKPSWRLPNQGFQFEGGHHCNRRRAVLARQHVHGVTALVRRQDRIVWLRSFAYCLLSIAVQAKLNEQTNNHRVSRSKSEALLLGRISTRPRHGWPAKVLHWIGAAVILLYRRPPSPASAQYCPEVCTIPSAAAWQ